MTVFILLLYAALFLVVGWAVLNIMADLDDLDARIDALRVPAMTELFRKVDPEKADLLEKLRTYNPKASPAETASLVNEIAEFYRSKGAQK